MEGDMLLMLAVLEKHMLVVGFLIVNNWGVRSCENIKSDRVVRKSDRVVRTGLPPLSDSFALSMAWEQPTWPIFCLY